MDYFQEQARDESDEEFHAQRERDEIHDLEAQLEETTMNLQLAAAAGLQLQIQLRDANALLQNCKKENADLRESIAEKNNLIAMLEAKNVKMADILEERDRDQVSRENYTKQIIANLNLQLTDSKDKIGSLEDQLEHLSSQLQIDARKAESEKSSHALVNASLRAENRELKSKLDDALQELRSFHDLAASMTPSQKAVDAQLVVRCRLLEDRKNSALYEITSLKRCIMKALQILDALGVKQAGEKIIPSIETPTDVLLGMIDSAEKRIREDDLTLAPRSAVSPPRLHLKAMPGISSSPQSAPNTLGAVVELTSTGNYANYLEERDAQSMDELDTEPSSLSDWSTAVYVEVEELSPREDRSLSLSTLHSESDYASHHSSADDSQGDVEEVVLPDLSDDLDSGRVQSPEPIVRDPISSGIQLLHGIIEVAPQKLTETGNTDQFTKRNDYTFPSSAPHANEKKEIIVDPAPLEMDRKQLENKIFQEMLRTTITVDEVNNGDLDHYASLIMKISHKTEFLSNKSCYERTVYRKTKDIVILRKLIQSTYQSLFIPVFEVLPSSSSTRIIAQSFLNELCRIPEVEDFVVFRKFLTLNYDQWVVYCRDCEKGQSRQHEKVTNLRSYLENNSPEFFHDPTEVNDHLVTKYKHLENKLNALRQERALRKIQRLQQTDSKLIRPGSDPVSSQDFTLDSITTTSPMSVSTDLDEQIEIHELELSDLSEFLYRDPVSSLLGTVEDLRRTCVEVQQRIETVLRSKVFLLQDLSAARKSMEKCLSKCKKEADSVVTHVNETWKQLQRAPVIHMEALLQERTRLMKIAFEKFDDPTQKTDLPPQSLVAAKKVTEMFKLNLETRFANLNVCPRMPVRYLKEQLNEELFKERDFGQYGITFSFESNSRDVSTISTANARCELIDRICDTVSDLWLDNLSTRSRSLSSSLMGSVQRNLRRLSFSGPPPPPGAFS
eukprot:TRINITY_DN14342_c0_g1_i1.p1 TRINITY_DN14342_c0_g1~~TRINITY_DN14342_c0_g1_i1.p1  ORF type:complete len:956 (-),score=182.75 TRINITY_DN14342_c0_g1_i1:214-3081(-)